MKLGGTFKYQYDNLIRVLLTRTVKGGHCCWTVDIDNCTSSQCVPMVVTMVAEKKNELQRFQLSGDCVSLVTRTP